MTKRQSVFGLLAVTLLPPAMLNQPSSSAGRRAHQGGAA